jgi:2-haloacid dehalogenase
VADRWVTFDCYRTLIDWYGGMLAALAPLAGDRAEALLGAYHAPGAAGRRVA